MKTNRLKNTLCTALILAPLSFANAQIDFTQYKAEFDDNYACQELKAPKKNSFFFTPKSSTLNKGEAIMYGDIKHTTDFSKSDLSKFKQLDQLFDNILGQSNKSNLSYNMLFLSTQFYELKNVTPEDFGEGDQIFRDDLYREMVYGELNMQLGQEGVDDYSYIVQRELNLFVGGDLVGKTTHFKVNKDDLTDQQKTAIAEVSPFGIPQRVAISSMRSPRIANDTMFDLSGKQHPTFRGSTSITLYYSINNGQDTLVMTLQAGKFNMGRFKAMAAKGLYSIVSGLFSGGTKTSISSTRQYFSQR